MKKYLTFEELKNDNAVFIRYPDTTRRGQSIKNGIETAPVEYTEPGDNGGIVIHTIDSTMFGDISFTFKIKSEDKNKSIVQLEDLYIATDKELLIDIK